MRKRKGTDKEREKMEELYERGGGEREGKQRVKERVRKKGKQKMEKG